MAISVRAELTLEQQGGEAAVRLLRKSLEDVRAMRCEPLSKCVAGFLIFYLAEVGQTDAAAQVWRDHALPDKNGRGRRIGRWNGSSSFCSLSATCVRRSRRRAAPRPTHRPPGGGIRYPTRRTDEM